MPSVVRVSAELFPEVYEGVLQPLNPDLPVATWRRLFEPRGWSDDEYFGFGMTEGGKFVGLMGALFSDRELEGRKQRFCNLHSWYVQPAFRGPASLLLLRPVLALKETVLTDFSATPEVVEMFNRLGFTSLGNALTLLPPLPFSGGRVEPPLELGGSPGAAETILSPGDLRIFRHHQGIDCRHLVVQDEGGEYCYVVASRPDGGPLAHLHVHFVSRPRLLARHHLAFRTALLEGGARYVAIPTRLLEGVEIPLALRGLGGQTFCRPAVQPSRVDSLYSEMALLKLPVVPQIPGWVRTARRLARRVTGRS